MNKYIIESMAQVGCGVTDTKEVAETVSRLPKKAHDVLDTWYNIGRNIELRAEYQAIAQMLKDKFSDDDITCLSTFINATRNVTS